MTEKRRKPGPEAARLKIDLDPDEALRRLVAQRPKPQNEGQESEKDEEKGAGATGD